MLSVNPCSFFFFTYTWIILDNILPIVIISESIFLYSFSEFLFLNNFSLKLYSSFLKSLLLNTFYGLFPGFLKIRKDWMQCCTFSSSVSNKKCIHVCLFKSHSCLSISEWNLSSLQHRIAMTPSSILPRCLQDCCYFLVSICTFDYYPTFLRITVICHFPLLRFILLLPFCFEKILLFST